MKTNFQSQSMRDLRKFLRVQCYANLNHCYANLINSPCNIKKAVINESYHFKKQNWFVDSKDLASKILKRKKQKKIFYIVTLMINSYNSYNSYNRFLEQHLGANKTLEKKFPSE